jgi:predicted aminopeptidase
MRTGPTRVACDFSLNPFLRSLPLVLLLVTTACAGPSWYAQAISGHWRLMAAREDINALLAADDTDPELARQLRMAAGIVEFGRGRLALEAGDNYRQYVATGRDAVTWNVVAAPEFSLQPRRWCFPVAGCVAYRGYFQRDHAERFAASLRNSGYDVSVSTATAYSTLGWFDDPLLDTMMHGGDERLAAVIFHEMAHETLYLRGDTGFSEAYARFVEQLGVEVWLQESGRADRLPGWQGALAAGRSFSELLRQVRARLETVYAADIPTAEKRNRKADAFAWLRSAYDRLVAERWQGRDYYGGWFVQDMNNARLVLAGSYEGGVCAFSALLLEVDGDFRRFHQRAADMARLADEKRRAWLDQPCGDIASAADL